MRRGRTRRLLRLLLQALESASDSQSLTSGASLEGWLPPTSDRTRHAGDFFKAYVLVGDLDLSATYDARTWPRALQASARACQDDARVKLEAGFVFACPARPAAGAGSGAADDWMYGPEGSLLLREDDVTGGVLAALMRVTGPRNKVVDRDAAAKNYRRFFRALERIACARSSYFEAVLQDPNTPVEEVSEYIADTWRKMYMYFNGHTFGFGERFS